MKKTLSVILAILVVFSLCACTQTSQGANSQQPASSASTASPSGEQQTVTPAAPAATADPSTIESQLNFIYDNLGVLKSQSEYQNLWYTITDLDHNGRVEIIAAITEGDNSVTRGVMYEIASTFDNLTAVNLGLDQGQYLPEIVTPSADTYRVGDTFNYIFKDTTSIGMPGHYVTLTSMSLSNGALKLDPLAYQDVRMTNGFTEISCVDKNGKDLGIYDLNDFDRYPEKVYPGALKSTTNFDWFSLNDVTTVDRLKQSYNTFNPGGALPVVAPSAAPFIPQTIVTPAPTTYIVDVVPVVTKDPTSESVIEGGTAYFVARADTYNYMAWSLIDPYGNVYGATTTPYPNMVVSGSTSETLALSNIPIGMNGWSVRATFYGKTNTDSRTAQIYVSQAPAKTVSSSPSSGTYFSDYNNWVGLYSSTGENIHYEAYKSGDTGPYESATVASGQGINVTGINGQCITVTVYANVVGSDKQSVFYYTVDCTPVPPPVPVPTPDPGPTTARGQIGTIESMNAVPIIIDGGTFWTTRDFITPTGSDLYEGRWCTVYYSGSYDNIYSVVLD